MGLQDLSSNSLDNGKVSSLKCPGCSDYDSDEAVKVSGNGAKRQRRTDASDHDLIAMEEEDLIRELDVLLDHEDEEPRGRTAEYDDPVLIFDLEALIGESDILLDPAPAHEAVVVPHEIEIEEELRECDDEDDDEGLITDFFDHIGGEEDEYPDQELTITITTTVIVVVIIIMI